MRQVMGTLWNYYLDQIWFTVAVPATIISPAAATVMMTIRVISITSRCHGCAMNPELLPIGCDCAHYRTKPCVRYSWQIYQHFR